MFKKIISSGLGQSVIAGLVLLLISKGLNEYGGLTMKDILQTFVIELWYVWIAIIGAVIYYYVKSFNELRNWIGHPNIDYQKNSEGGYHNLMEAIERTVDRRIKDKELLH